MNLSFVIISVFVTLTSSEELSDFSVYKSNLSKANFEFAIECLRDIGVSKFENAMFSPIGLLQGLSLLLLGCRGNTRRQLMETLKYSHNFANHTMVHKAFRSFTNLMKDVDGHYTLKHANRLLINRDFETKEDFKEGARKYYNSSIEEVFFEEDGDIIVEETNSWISNVTNGKIRSIVKSKFRNDTLLILLNVVYFKGWWQSQFKTDRTEVRTFFVNGEEEKDIDFMNQVTIYNTTETDEYFLLRLNYEADFSFYVLLPHKNKGLQKIINEIDHKTLIENIQNMTENKVNLFLPKFKLETTYRITDLLGGNELFTSEANLTGISDHGNLRATGGIHKAYINVNERGTEAAAGTAIQVQARSTDIDVKTIDVDHPFLFFIVHNPTDIIWFMGIVSHFT